MSPLKIKGIIGHVFTSLTVVFTVLYFFSVFDLEIDVPDFFYDADTPRTLYYLNEPNSSISSIRPFLFPVAWILKLSLGTLQPYLVWTTLNIICALIQIICIKQIFREMNFSLMYTSFILTNFSALCWIVVPDTFMLGVTFFLLSIVLYGDGSSKLRIFFSGILATGMNLFLLLPWLLSHILLGRKFIINSFIRAMPVIIIVTAMTFATQYLQRFKSTFQNEDYEFSIQAIEPSLISNLSGQSGVLASMETLVWIHSPFTGILKNLLSYFTAPWTQGYSYISGTYAIDSIFHPFWVLFLAITMTFFSFVGIYFLRNEFGVFASFLFSLEISTCFLFLTYSYHPYLFAPFLLVSRISGLIFFVRRFDLAIAPFLLITVSLTVLSLHFLP